MRSNAVHLNIGFNYLCIMSFKSNEVHFNGGPKRGANHEISIFAFLAFFFPHAFYKGHEAFVMIFRRGYGHSMRNMKTDCEMQNDTSQCQTEIFHR
jgi:hypothetical protein